MSTTCLVTRLKEAVSDQSLPKLGVIKLNLRANASASGSLYRVLGDPSILSLVSGSVSLVDYNTSTPISLPMAITMNNSWITFSTGANGAVVEISNKYSIASMNGLFKVAGEFNLADCAYMKSLTLFESVAGNIVSGNVSAFGTCEALTALRLSGSESSPLTSKIVGDVADLGPCTALTSMNIYNTAVGGDLLQLAKAQKANGRTTGSISLGWLNSGVKFNGVVCSTNSDTTLSWTASSVTWNGTTVNE